MPCRNISLIRWISCPFGEFISLVTPPIIQQSRHVWYWCGFQCCLPTECACADWPISARVSSLRMREAFHRWKFPALFCLAPLENAFTRVCDNCEITSKTRNAAVKWRTKRVIVSSKLPRAAQLQTTWEKKRGNWNVAATELDADAVSVSEWQLVASVGPRVCYSVPFSVGHLPT